MPLSDSSDTAAETSALNRRYDRLEIIGEGVYGTVYKALNTSTDEIVALKKIRLDEDEEGIPATAIREISLLQALEHKNVVALYDLVCSATKLYLVFEYLDLDLRKYQKQHKCISGERLRSFAYQLVNGVGFCHAHRILHRDLKPQNILLNKNDWTLKIADFGLARMFGVPLKNYTHEVVTLWYRAPEILLGARKYGSAVDLWSVGCVFAEMALGNPLFPGDSEIGTIFRIFRALGFPTDDVWSGVSQLPNWKDTFPKWKAGNFDAMFAQTDLGESGLDLLNKFLKYAPDSRLPCLEARDHKFFESVDKSPYEYNWLEGNIESIPRP